VPAAALDRASGVSLYRQLAQDLRRRIKAGEWAPGGRLPSEAVLCHEYDLGRDAVRRGLAILRDADVIVTRSGQQARVAQRSDDGEVIVLPPGSEWWARLATSEECRENGWPLGSIAVVVRRGSVTRLFGAHLHRFRT
jgi:DNA-binding transcriptional regulator YhcF (GntR family)